MGHARCSFTCLISSTTNLRTGSLYCVVIQTLLNRLTWLQVISMVLRGDAAAETTSVLLTKPLLTGHQALHHCGDPDQFRTTGLTSADFLNHQAPIDIGRCACTVHSPSHEELLACDQLIKVAIMRHGSIWISSTGATLGYRKENTVDTFSSKNVLRHINPDEVT